MKNYGLNLEKEKLEQSDKDWVFGAIPSCLAQIPELRRFEFLPRGELQKGVEDFMDCATRAPLNILETKFNWLLKNKKLSFNNEMWFKQMGYVTEQGVEFSDRFVAINSQTTRQGNSLKAPLEAIRKQGLIPKQFFPASPSFTWDEYHDASKITDLMRKLGLEFVERFHINYEKVYEQYYAKLLKQDMIDVAGYAWPEPEQGEYPRVEGDPNHAFVAIRNPKYLIFDNYIDSVDQDWIKKLASDYSLLPYGYRLSVNQSPIIPAKPLLDRLLGWFSNGVSSLLSWRTHTPQNSLVKNTNLNNKLK